MKRLQQDLSSKFERKKTPGRDLWLFSLVFNEENPKKMRTVTDASRAEGPGEGPTAPQSHQWGRGSHKQLTAREDSSWPVLSRAPGTAMSSLGRVWGCPTSTPWRSMGASPGGCSCSGLCRRGWHLIHLAGGGAWMLASSWDCWGPTDRIPTWASHQGLTLSGPWHPEVLSILLPPWHSPHHFPALPAEPPGQCRHLELAVTQNPWVRLPHTPQQDHKKLHCAQMPTSVFDYTWHLVTKGLCSQGMPWNLP